MCWPLDWPVSCWRPPSCWITPVSQTCLPSIYGNKLYEFRYLPYFTFTAICHSFQYHLSFYYCLCAVGILLMCIVAFWSMGLVGSSAYISSQFWPDGPKSEPGSVLSSVLWKATWTLVSTLRTPRVFCWPLIYQGWKSPGTALAFLTRVFGAVICVPSGRFQTHFHLLQIQKWSFSLFTLREALPSPWPSVPKWPRPPHHLHQPVAANHHGFNWARG